MRVYKPIYGVLKKMIKSEALDPKILKLRGKIELFRGVDKSSFTAIIVLHQKSRIVVKDLARLESIVEKMTNYYGHRFEKKELVYEAPLCSKAKKLLEHEGWSLVHASL